MTTIMLTEALSGAERCKHCCIESFRQLAKSLYKTDASNYTLFEIMNRSLEDLRSNYEIKCVTVAARLRKLERDCVFLPNTCGQHHAALRREIWIPTPAAPIPLTYQGFSLKWQDF